MIILACETSTLLGSVSVIKDGVVLSERHLLRQGSHTEILNTFISECLADANLTLNDVDCFATGLGPGSFTGLRISLNTIKTFGYIFNKPVVGFDSLLNLAFENKNILTVENKKITSMINAYKNMVYIAEYELKNNELIEIKPPQVVRVQELEQFITEKIWIVGDGYLAYEKYFSENLKILCLRTDHPSDHPTAKSLGLIAAQAQNKNKFTQWHQLLPLYLRSSEAEEVMAGIKYQAL
jgi:tRNA threonylcarbamoyladenosine biosynthesis protein TsaB